MKKGGFLRKGFFTLVLLLIVSAGYTQSIGLNGTNQYASPGNAASLHLTNFTLEAWIKIEGTGATTNSSTSNGLSNVVPILTKGRSENDGDPTKEVNYFMGYNPANGKLVADFEDNNNGSNHPVTGNAVISSCTWTHVAASFNVSSNTWKLYINGALDQTLNLGATIFTPQSLSNMAAGIGTSFSSTGVAEGFFKGRIDEMRIWNTVRTDAEILANYNSELTSGAGLAGRWGFNEGAGVNAANSIIGGPAASLTGTPPWRGGFNQIAADKSYAEFDGTDDYVNFGQYLSGGALTKGTIEFWFKARTLDANSQYLFSLTKSGGQFDGEMRCFINESDAATSPNRLIFEIQCAGPNTTHTVTSSNVLTAGTWYHVALTWESDVANSMKMFINGLQTGSSVTPACGIQITDQDLNIGRNNASAAGSYFDGYMDELRIWDVIRTAGEIQSNVLNEITSGTGLKGRWGFNEGCGTSAANSIPAGAGGTLVNGVLWVAGSASNLAPNQPSNPSPPNNGGTSLTTTPVCANVSDPNGGSVNVKYYGRPKNAAAGSNQKFTVILLPDTQYYTAEPQGTNGGNNSIFKTQTAWIANNRQSMNIVYVGQLGDCSEHGDANEIEWKRVDTSIRTIENPVLTGLPQGLPYGLSVGNHDQSPNGGGASATTGFFNQYFGEARFAGRSYYGGHFGTNNDNNYQLFSASGVDFLVISMEYDTSPLSSVLDWAANLVQTYSNRKVIVMTHFGINETGSPKPSFGAQGQAIYDKLKQYPNFMLFVCGHIHQMDGEAQRSDTFNGNTVYTMMSDYQGRTKGGNGLLRILEFDPALNKVSVKTYSPYTSTFETDADSQFDLSVNLAPSNNFSLLGEITNVPSGSAPCFNWQGLANSTEYEWYMEIGDGEATTTGPIWSFLTAAGSPLPVTLVDFTATPDQNKVKVSWSTAYEKDNLLFEIQRSVDGIKFSTIGTVNGHGNNSSLQYYSFDDQQPLSGLSYYRLKQVDIDRKFSYSKIVTVVITPTTGRFIVYPNPVTGKQFKIRLNNTNVNTVEVGIYNTEGNLYFEKIYPGSNNITVQHRLNPGTYILKITTLDYSENHKLIIQ